MTEYPIMRSAEPVTRFEPWFAWYPVRTWDMRWRWLCWVDRRILQMKEHIDHGQDPWFQYRRRQR